MGTHALGEFPQHLVAGVVAIGIVDRLEAVDVEEDYESCRPRAAASSKSAAKWLSR
jgi:hypothetical protein